MRISTMGAYQRGLGMMQRLQASLDRTQHQLSLGRALISPADDPLAASRAVELHESLSRMEQFERNSDTARNRLGHEEVALTSVNDLLQRVRELSLQANNDSQSNESRHLIAIELRQRLDDLVQVANQRDGTGRYLFAGHRDGTAPVTRSGSNFSYNGDQGQRMIQIAEDRQVADGDSGASVFFMIRDGNGVFSATPMAGNAGNGMLASSSVADITQYDRDDYTIRFTAADSYDVLDSGGGLVATAAFESGDNISFRGIEVSITGQPAVGDEFYVNASRNQDIFSSIRDLADILDTPVTNPASRAAVHNGVNASLNNIDQGIGRVLDVRTQVGTRLAALDSQLDSNSAFALTIQETLSGLEDLDYAEALSRLTIQATTLEAAQASFVRTQSLSLFNFL